MKILADENVHPVVVVRLRAEGLVVEWIAETAPGLSDTQILARADIRELVLITYDRDFGDLIFNHNLTRPKAVIYSRLGRAEPRYLANCILQLLEKNLFVGHIHVIKKDGIRSTPFPNGANHD